MLRGAHEAARDFVPPQPPRWRPWFGRSLLGDRPVIGHCDAGPWNWVAGSDGLPYALVDWEFAGPVDALWELAQVTWLNAQLHDDDIADLHGLPAAHHRAAQARSIVDGYGLARADRRGMVDRMIEFAIHAARAEAETYHVTARNHSGNDSRDYPILWAIAWRARSASWLIRNRATLENAMR